MQLKKQGSSGKPLAGEKKNVTDRRTKGCLHFSSSMFSNKHLGFDDGAPPAGKAFIIFFPYSLSKF